MSKARNDKNNPQYAAEQALFYFYTIIFYLYDYDDSG